MSSTSMPPPAADRRGSIATGTTAADGAPLVALIIPTWNRREEVLRCLASVEQLAYPRVLTVVVDNGSEDGTSDAVRAQFPEVMLIRHAHNRGYAGGNNAGIRWAAARGAAYAFLVNNDSVVTAEVLTRLVQVAESDPRIGAVGSRNLVLEDPARLWGAYGKLSYGPFLVRPIGHYAPDGPRWQVVRDVDWIIGSGSLWRMAAIERVGLLDESLFAYHDDVDWCERLRRAGYRIVYGGTAAVMHEGGGSSDPRRRHRFRAGYFLGRNGVLFVRKYASWGQTLRFAVLCGGALALRLARAALLRGAMRDPEARCYWQHQWRREIDFARGIADALRRRPIPFAKLGMTVGVEESGAE